MLSPELKKLKEKLTGKYVEIDNTALYNELDALDRIVVYSPELTRSLALSNGVCPTCGKRL